MADLFALQSTSKSRVQCAHVVQSICSYGTGPVLNFMSWAIWGFVKLESLGGRKDGCKQNMTMETLVVTLASGTHGNH